MAAPTIFVMDSDPLFVDLIRDVLIDAGYSSAVSYLGDHTFQRIRDEHPALILLDISPLKPGRSWALLNAVRRHPQTRAIAMIICSTDMRMINEKADLLRAMSCQTLEKPFDIETLLDKVAAAIGPPPGEQPYHVQLAPLSSSGAM